MAIKGKPLRQEIVMAGDADQCLKEVQKAFESGGFTTVDVDDDDHTALSISHCGDVARERPLVAFSRSIKALLEVEISILPDLCRHERFDVGGRHVKRRK